MPINADSKIHSIRQVDSLADLSNAEGGKIWDE